MDKKISVIIPTYNCEKYIERCLLSVINQSYKNLEIIVVDDYSTDNTNQVIQGLCKNDCRIKLISLSDNHGVGYARNMGLSNASGEYISFVDSDDWLDSNMLFELIDACESNNAEIAICSIIDEYENMASCGYRYDYKKDNVINNRFALNLLSRTENQDIFISPIVNNKLYLTSFLQRILLKFPEGIQFEDNVFTFLLLTNECKICIVSDVQYHYYQRQSSLFHSVSNKYIDDFFLAFNLIKQDLTSQKIYWLYQNAYIAFFDRTLSMVLKMVISNECKTEEVKKVLRHLFETLIKDDNLFERYIEYFDIKRIQSLFFTK